MEILKQLKTVSVSTICSCQGGLRDTVSCCIVFKVMLCCLVLKIEYDVINRRFLIKDLIEIAVVVCLYMVSRGTVITVAHNFLMNGIIITVTHSYT